MAKLRTLALAGWDRSSWPNHLAATAPAWLPLSSVSGDEAVVPQDVDQVCDAVAEGGGQVELRDSPVGDHLRAHLTGFGPGRGIPAGEVGGPVGGVGVAALGRGWAAGWWTRLRKGRRLLRGPWRSLGQLALFLFRRRLEVVVGRRDFAD